jgi:hypothetical protein
MAKKLKELFCSVQRLMPAILGMQRSRGSRFKAKSL